MGDWNQQDVLDLEVGADHSLFGMPQEHMLSWKKKNYGSVQQLLLVIEAGSMQIVLLRIQLYVGRLKTWRSVWSA